MKIAARTTLLVTAATLIVIGTYGWSTMRQEEHDLGATLDLELRLIGSAVRVSVGNALRDGQIADVQSTLDELKKVDPAMEVYVFGKQHDLLAQSEGSALGSQHADLAEQALEKGLPVLIKDPLTTLPDPKAMLVLPSTKDALGVSEGIAIELSLGETKRDLHDTERDIFTSFFVLILTTTFIQFLVGTTYITRPLNGLVAAMKGLRSGESLPRMPTRRNDEVGHLIDEFGRLVEDLRKARERVEQEVESRAGLEQGLQRIDRLVTIGQLSAGLAHEIGSPLQILNGRARAMLQRPMDAEAVHHHAQILVEQSDRIARIVEQLLDFSRRRAPKLVQGDIRKPIQSVLSLMDFIAYRKGVVIEFHDEKDLPDVYFDSDQIQQMVLNLLKNALQATEKGGRILVKIEGCRVQRGIEAELVPGVRIVVEDQGGGMSKELLDNLFVPFFTTRNNEGGSGLGLSVVKAIAVEHGGDVSAASTLGKGSRFVIDLPATRPDWDRDSIGGIA